MGLFSQSGPVWPAYSRIRYAGIGYLLRHLMPIALMPLAALGLVAAILRRGKVEWERWALFLAMAIGAFSYFAQGKGTTYQRYMFVFFLALWIGWELSEAMNRSETRLRAVGVAGAGRSLSGGCALLCRADASWRAARTTWRAARFQS